ncbi:MAG: hypothetical protein F4103_16635 [Boseongicola sp. SB0673_bin_14]|nr:hypothetical protein [Boseongicola sp. SB0667_bin_21]MYI70288.1 hypothetical protein [Boseongicola sp. SB0673_bin_14]
MTNSNPPLKLGTPSWKASLSRGLLVTVLTLSAALAPATADERNAFASAGLVPELTAGLSAAEARIEQLENELLAVAIAIRNLNTALDASQSRVKRLEDVLDGAWARILRLEAGNQDWLERMEAAEREHTRDLREARERLLNAPQGKTLNELFRVGEPRRARPAVGYDEVPLPDDAKAGR